MRRYEKKLSLVSPVYKTEKFLKRFIDSCLIQNYKNWELILSLDGYNKECVEIIKKYKDKRISYIINKHQGACQARNEGIKKTTGDYIAFPGSDFTFMAGIFYTWIDELEKHPEAGFIYGNYLVNFDKIDDPHMVTSREFDAWELEMNNYIDGGFPIRIGLCPFWDPKIKSLQDWDMILRLVKKGVKGHFISQISYYAEPPRKGGLSYDSHNNWITRVRAVKRNNKIPIRKECVASIGAYPHAYKVSKLLNWDLLWLPKPIKYKVMYILGFYINNLDAHISLFQGTTTNIVHWVGSDIEMIKNMSVTHLKQLVNIFSRARNVIHLTECARTQVDLRNCGIKSEVLPLPVADPGVFPLPREKVIGIYYPIDRNRYMENLIDDIIRSCPDIKFMLFGGLLYGKMFNVEAVGWTDIKNVIKQCSHLIRFTISDGLPITPIEFLLSQRKVITNVPDLFGTSFIEFPASVDDKTYPALKEKIVSTIRHSDVGFSHARNYWLQETNVKTLKRKLNKIVTVMTVLNFFSRRLGKIRMWLHLKHVKIKESLLK